MKKKKYVYTVLHVVRTRTYSRQVYYFFLKKVHFTAPMESFETRVKTMFVSKVENDTDEFFIQGVESTILWDQKIIITDSPKQNTVPLPIYHFRNVITTKTPSEDSELNSRLEISHKKEVDVSGKPFKRLILCDGACATLKDADIPLLIVGITRNSSLSFSNCKIKQLYFWIEATCVINFSDTSLFETVSGIVYNNSTAMMRNCIKSSLVVDGSSYASVEDCKRVEIECSNESKSVLCGVMGVKYTLRGESHLEIPIGTRIYTPSTKDDDCIVIEY